MFATLEVFAHHPTLPYLINIFIYNIFILYHQNKLYPRNVIHRKYKEYVAPFYRL